MTSRLSGRAVAVPADVTQPDRILFRLTPRQVAVFAAAAVLLWLGWRVLHTAVPAMVLVAAAIPVVAGAMVVALGRRDGLPLDRWLGYALRAWRAPKRLATHSGRRAAESGVEVLRLPATAIGADGTVDLLGDGHAVMVAVPTVGYFLADPDTQAAVAAGFARWCNSLTGHTQITVSNRPVDLHAVADIVDRHRCGLPHPALASAAAAYGSFLRQLAEDRDPLYRQVLVTHTGSDPLVIRRAAEHTARVLSTGDPAQILDAATVTDLLHSAADPWHPPAFGHALPDAIVTADRSRP